jgi:hypothetical protein
VQYHAVIYLDDLSAKKSRMGELMSDHNNRDPDEAVQLTY